MQIAYWKTKDGKHWLKLHQNHNSAGRLSFCYETNGSKEDLRAIWLEDALYYVQHIIDHWPSKGIRQH